VETVADEARLIVALDGGLIEANARIAAIDEILTCAERRVQSKEAGPC